MHSVNLIKDAFVVKHYYFRPKQQNCADNQTTMYITNVNCTRPSQGIYTRYLTICQVLQEFKFKLQIKFWVKIKKQLELNDSIFTVRFEAHFPPFIGRMLKKSNLISSSRMQSYMNYMHLMSEILLKMLLSLEMTPMK